MQYNEEDIKRLFGEEDETEESKAFEFAQKNGLDEAKKVYKLSPEEWKSIETKLKTQDAKKRGQLMRKGGGSSAAQPSDKDKLYSNPFGSTFGM